MTLYFSSCVTRSRRASTGLAAPLCLSLCPGTHLHLLRVNIGSARRKAILHPQHREGEDDEYRKRRSGVSSDITVLYTPEHLAWKTGVEMISIFGSYS